MAWTVPWAYDPRTEELNESFPVFDERGGSAMLYVRRAVDGTLTVGLDHRSDYTWT
jgi:hypothetical protein